MSNARKPFLENWFYHIYNRWFKKQQLFFNNRDYERFFEVMKKNLLELNWKIKLISYCILPNHFHLIIQNKEEWLFVSEFMRKVQVSISMYLKTKYKEIFEEVPIFQWRFRAKQIISDDYFNKCLYYVNYNAVKHEIVDKIEDYPYSSIHQLLETGLLETGLEVDYKLENWLEEFFDDIWDFEF